MTGIPFVPPEASTFAPQVDHLFIFELAVAAFFTSGICLFIVFFCIRYRRRSDDEIPPKMPKHYGLEITWIIIPFLLMLVMYFWGAYLYVNMKHPAEEGLEIHVIGKQWMWKIEQPYGVREINQMHVPVGEPIKLILASQDVIHDFFVPAFRMKQDLVPGSYVTEWFEATKVGTFHLFCSQYCGTGHSTMVGQIVVMNKPDYQAWLAGAVPSQTPEAGGKLLFTSLGCVECHGQRGPTLAGLYGSRVTLQSGQVVTADEQYLHTAILNPSSQLVAGFPAVMPSFQGQISEEQVYELIAYIKSLSTVRNNAAGNISQPPAPALAAPSTRPAPSGQPQSIPNFPPAETPFPPAPSQQSIQQSGE
jgi:cytochrome c oxidase subunit 2